VSAEKNQSQTASSTYISVMLLWSAVLIFVGWHYCWYF